MARFDHHLTAMHGVHGPPTAVRDATSSAHYCSSIADPRRSISRLSLSLSFLVRLYSYCFFFSCIRLPHTMWTQHHHSQCTIFGFKYSSLEHIFIVTLIAFSSLPCTYPHSRILVISRLHTQFCTRANTLHKCIPYRPTASHGPSSRRLGSDFVNLRTLLHGRSRRQCGSEQER